MAADPRRPAKPVRADQLAADRGLFPSREAARRAILAGELRADGRPVDKPGRTLPQDARLEAAARPRFVGRGGLKLEAALDAFAIDPSGLVCADIGASTGGFTDCLLQRCAARVYAIDVGHGQLDWKLRNDPRVLTIERCNARHLKPGDLPESPALATIDVSFISLTLILPAVLPLLTPNGVAVALIKPQFELGPRDVGRGGIVRDPALHAKAVEKIRAFAAGLPDAEWAGSADSPITGADGNREFFACLRKR